MPDHGSERCLQVVRGGIGKLFQLAVGAGQLIEAFVQLCRLFIDKLLQLIPLLVITPLVFLGGAFYSVSMLPPGWQTVTYFNPVLYLISGFRWTFFGVADVPVGLSLAAITVFLAACLTVIWTIFRTGWRIKP